MLKSDTEIIQDEIAPVITEMGMELVELKVGRTKNLQDITVIIYRAQGVSVEDCARLSKSIQPRIDLLENFGEARIKVASPGLDRIIKHEKEYQIFTGRGVKILLIDKSDWTGGIIQSMEKDILHLKCGKEIVDIDLKRIKKAKLDYNEEVKK